MSFIKKGFSFKAFNINKSFGTYLTIKPKDFCEKINDCSFKEKELKYDEVNAGFCQHLNFNKTVIDIDSMVGSNFYIVGFRIDKGTVDNKTFKLRVDSEIDLLPQPVNQKTKTKLRQEIREDMVQNKSELFVMIFTDNRVFINTNKESVIDSMKHYVNKALGAEMFDFSPFAHGCRRDDEFLDTVSDTKDYVFYNEPDEEMFSLAVDTRFNYLMMTYWFLKRDEYEAVFSDDIRMEGVELGAKDVIFKGGVITTSKEFKQALRNSKLMSKSRINLGVADGCLEFTLDARSMYITSVKYEGEKDDVHTIEAKLINNLAFIQHILDAIETITMDFYKDVFTNRNIEILALYNKEIKQYDE